MLVEYDFYILLWDKKGYRGPKKLHHANSAPNSLQSGYSINKKVTAKGDYRAVTVILKWSM